MKIKDEVEKCKGRLIKAEETVRELGDGSEDIRQRAEKKRQEIQKAKACCGQVGRVDKCLRGVAEGEGVQNVAEAIFEERNAQEVSGLDKMCEYAHSRRFTNPKQNFRSPQPGMTW